MSEQEALAAAIEQAGKVLHYRCVVIDNGLNALALTLDYKTANAAAMEFRQQNVRCHVLERT